MCNDPNCGENSCDCSHANCPCRTTTTDVEMSDAEKIERLASEVRELRNLLSKSKHYLGFAPMSFTNMEEILQIRDEIDKLTK